VNGVDDNDDTLVDCADPQCSGYRCVPRGADTWSAPSVLFLEQSTAVVPDCPADWSQATSLGAGFINAPAAQCTACGCDDPSDVECQGPSYEGFAVNDCSGTPLATVTPEADTCTGFGGPSYESARQVGTASASGGTCPTLGGVPTVPAATWSELGRVCAATTGTGCDVGEVCAPTQPLGFDPTLCVTHAGDLSCPSTDYTAKTLAFTSMDDTRGCEPCQCAAPAGISCTRVGWLYTTQLCTQTPTAVPAGGDCLALGGFRSIEFDAVVTDGYCTPSGGEPTGAAAPGNALTVCCMP
jgi:hypothetical protein